MVLKELSYHTTSIVQLGTYMKHLPVYILDPTLTDAASKVRGIGRYVQLLRETLSDQVQFVGSTDEIPYESIYLDAHFNFLRFEWPRRIARYQIAFLYDLIPQKYPEYYPIGVKGAIISHISRMRLKQYDLLFTLTESTKSDIIQMLDIPEQSVQVMYSTLPKKTSKTGKTDKVQTPDSPYFLYVGDVTWNKNLLTLAKAIKIAHLPCAFVGKYFIRYQMNHVVQTKEKAPNPWLHDVYSFYEEAYDNDLFLFQGFVDENHLVNLYQHAAANILVSYDEGFGMSILEAAEHGTASIVSDIPVFREIAGKAATYIHPDDPVALADAMKAFVQKKQTADEKSALKEMVERFSQKEFKRRLTEGFISVQTR